MPCSGCCLGCCYVQCVHTGSLGVIEACGKFEKLAPAGTAITCPPFNQMAGMISLRVQQLAVPCETKTRDNVFMRVTVDVQFEVITESAYDAFYKLQNPALQIQSYVFDVVRSALPKMTLEEAYASKDTIANDVKHNLDVQMAEYGFHILQALVTDMDPEPRVKESFNDINASRRLREAQQERAEAEKILQVKSAEADAESKYLAGVGVARQRAAIIEGIRDSVNDFSTSVKSTPTDVMHLLLLTQYFDMCRDIGQSASTVGNTLYLPHGPDSVGAIQDSVTVMKSMQR